MSGLAWQSQAACRGADPDLFFPVQNGRTVPTAVRALCDVCPVCDDCAQWGLWHEPHGIWGGLTQWELNDIRRRRRIHVPTGPKAAQDHGYPW